MKRQCTVEGCETIENDLARSMCSKHYTRWRKYGDPHIARPPRQPLHERFWDQVDITGDCWIWIGPINTTGYGLAAWVGTSSVLAHRTAYELLVGPVPAELHLDHVCHTNDPTCPGGNDCQHRRCVNPAHLEPVTPTENGLRQGVRLRACRRGHPFTPDNTGINSVSGNRFCRTCMRASQARSRAKARTA